MTTRRGAGDERCARSCLSRRWIRRLLVLGLLATGCTVSVGQNTLFPPRYEVLPSMSEGIERRNVQLRASDGVVLRGWYLEKPNSARTVLFFYGNRSSVVGSTWSLHWLAEALNANVVAFDYRGYGFSDGSASIDRIVRDALDVHAFAVDKLGRGGLPVVVVGQSLGTASALHVAANRNVDAVVLMAPLGSIDDLLAALRAQAPWYARVEADPSLASTRVLPAVDAGRVRARTLFISGAIDTLATPAVVARLSNACGAAAKFACRLPGGHGDIRAENPQVRSCIAGFVLDGSATRPRGVLTP